MFPRFFDLATTQHDLTSSHQFRELFGPLPEMVERRIHASNTVTNELNTRSVVGRGLPSVHEAQIALIPPSSSPQGPTLLMEARAREERGQLAEGEVVDLDVRLVDLDVMLAGMFAGGQSISASSGTLGERERTQKSRTAEGPGEVPATDLEEQVEGELI